MESYTDESCYPPESLLPQEDVWKERFYQLQERGYTLRPRYHPQWTPSWLTNGKDYLKCEDSVALNIIDVIDATKRDRTVVAIKWVRNGSFEVEIAQYLSSKELRRDTQNHCVPILDAFVDPNPVYPNAYFLVMPLLRSFDEPEFGALEEVVDFVDQVLAGLYFLHSHNIAHRDCAKENIMMDATELYPLGFHGVDDMCQSDGIRPLPYASRTGVRVTYYFVDFGMSCRKKPGEQITVLHGSQRAPKVPEIALERPHDPFKADICTLGHVLNDEFCQAYHGVEVLDDLVHQLIQVEPDDRPTAKEALDIWKQQRPRSKSHFFTTRIRRRDESYPEAIFNTSLHAMNDSVHAVKAMAKLLGG